MTLGANVLGTYPLGVSSISSGGITNNATISGSLGALSVASAGVQQSSAIVSTLLGTFITTVLASNTVQNNALLNSPLGALSVTSLGSQQSIAVVSASLGALGVPSNTSILIWLAFWNDRDYNLD